MNKNTLIEFETSHKSTFVFDIDKVGDIETKNGAPKAICEITYTGRGDVKKVFVDVWSLRGARIGEFSGVAYDVRKEKPFLIDVVKGKLRKAYPLPEIVEDEVNGGVKTKSKA